jgi:peptidoglycan-associated lipoprotein
MRKFAAVFMFILVCGVFAVAQMEPTLFEIPKTEVSVGYAYQHAGSINPINESGTINSTGLTGFAFEFSHYFYGNLGLTIDIARDSNKAVDPEGDGYVRTTYVGGPTYRLHRYGFFSPSLHVLAGVDRATINIAAGSAVLSAHDTDFAALAGGTLDGNLTKHLAIRLAQVDYLYTHNYGTNQSSYRYLGGIVFRF